MEENNSQEELRKKIDEAFDQLDWFIEKMPLNEEGKNYIWQYSFTQFYDSYLSSETGEPTYGIQTEWQLKCFKKQFNENIKQLKIKRMEAYSLELDNLPPLAAKDKVSRQLREIKRKRLLAEIGGAKPTEWDDWLQKYLSEEKLFIAERNDDTTPPKAETKTNKLQAELSKHGFFELPMVKQLSEQNQRTLVEQISINGFPYSIAMFDLLGFLKHLKIEYFLTDYKRFKAIAKWFDVNERTVKGNIYVLNEQSKEDRKRYTADQQKETVQNDYEKLK